MATGHSKTADRRPNIAEPNTTGTSWTSIRWNRSSGSAGGSVSARTARFATTSPQTSTTNSVASTSTNVGGIRARFNDSNRTTSPMVFTNVQPANPKPSAIAATSVNTTPIERPVRSTTKSTATNDYIRAITRRRAVEENRSNSTVSPSTSTQTRSTVPEVLSRFGSRNPAFLAGGVVRTSAPPQTTSRPIAKSERPWRQRLADSARIRNLEDVTRDLIPGSRSSAASLSPSSTVALLRNQQQQLRQSPSVVNASTPTSSVALRNYESKFKNRNFSSDSSRPTSLILTSNSLTNKYRPRTSITSATSGLPVGGLSRNSSTASSNLSLLSAMPTTSSSRFRSALASSTPLSISTRFTSTATPTARRLASTVMTSRGDEHKRMGEGTRWRKVENPPQVERQSRRDRSSSAKRRSRSRSLANEPPPPNSSSDEENQKNENQRVPPRARRLRKKSSTTNIEQENSKNSTGKQTKMPASAAEFEPTVDIVDVLTETQNKLTDYHQQSDTMNTSIHSTITNASDNMRLETADDETKYNAVARFKPAGLRQKRPSPKPVPGTWSYSANEVNISQNKAFKKRPIHVIVEIKMKDFPYARASTAYFRLPRKRLIRPQLVESRTIAATFMRPKQQNLNANITFKNRKPTIQSSASLQIREQPKVLRLTVDARIQEIFSNKRRLRLGVEKTLRIRGSVNEKATLRCKSAVDRGKLLNLNISRKPENRACNGTVKDEKEVTYAAIESGVYVAPVSVQMTLTQPPQLFSPTHQLYADDGGISSPEPYEPQLHIPVHRNVRPGDPLVLPDRSLLEEYVRRKRAHLESLNKRVPGYSPVDSSLAESPPPTRSVAAPAFGSTNPTIEFKAACPVQILEPHIQTALITTPTRSRVSSVEPPSISTVAATVEETAAMAPRPNELPAGVVRHVPVVLQHGPSGVQRDVQQLVVGGINHPANQQQNALFRGVLRKTSDPTGAVMRLKAQVFDTPKSPFEERMQNQASQLRKSSIGSSDTENEIQRPRHLVDGGVAQGFTAAIAQQPARQERYAAHIPVPSGRQSVTSLDSVNSALDTATRQLDSMIDLARHKHAQHRNKFKEFEYLDEIIEDLKKEYDPNTSNGNNSGPQPSTAQQKPRPFPVQSSLQATRENPRLQKIDQSRWRRRPNQPRIAHPVRVGPQLVSQQQSVQRNVSQRLPLKKQQSNIESNGDVECTETIVLPTKSTAERLDFTRQWVVDDISSWINRPANKSDSVPGNTNGQIKPRIASEESSEHSLGSCSAEVAAINATERRRKSTASGSKETKTAAVAKKKSEFLTSSINPKANVAISYENTFRTSNVVEQQKPTVTDAQPSQQPNGPIKPRAYRPQAQQQLISGQVATDQQARGYEAQKLGSQQDLRPATRESLDRPGSQDYQSLGSTQSTDGLRAANFNSLQRSVSGAFMQYPQRGSIQSLPDAVLVAGAIGHHGSSTTLQLGYGSTLGSFHQLHANDPAQAMNTLMAELDVNTSEHQRSLSSGQTDDSTDKRRSFPTTQTEVTFRSGGRSQSIGQATIASTTSPGPTRLNVPQQSNYSGSMDRGIRKIQQTQPTAMNPFTSKVLGPQKPQPPNPQRAQFDDAAHLLDSVIDELQPKSTSPTTTAKKRGMLQQLLGTTKTQQTTVNTVQGMNANQQPSGRPFLIGSKKPTSAVVGNTSQPLPQQKLTPTTTIRTALSGGKKTVINPPKPNSHLHGHGATIGQRGEQQQPTKTFEMINNERLNPSRVETMQQMFEKRPSGQRTANFRRNGSRELDPTYSEIGEFAREEQQINQNRTPSFKQSNRLITQNSNSILRPAFPTTQPPQRFVSPPKVSPQPLQRNLSIKSNNGSQLSEVDENEAEYVTADMNRNTETEGDIYDNLQDARNTSIRQQNLPPIHAPIGRFGGPIITTRQVPIVPPQPPPHKFQQQREPKGAGIGQLIRKLGGVAERPLVQQHQLNVGRMPTAGSVLSLNRIEQNEPKRAGVLMKSNSLSHEPWRIHAMDRDFNYNHTDGMNGKMETFRSKLKQTIFGSKKWLNS
ncbi:hypothetical protein M3Y98_00844600 [Aphelenchoides besseyi]|nr:hypothetical protein M3Y98_00844600 [Aphelenchoides besseyi]